MIGNQLNIDTLLLQQIAEGDEKAFEIFFKRTSSLLFSWICKLVKDEIESRAVLQDVYIQIWIYRDKLTGVEHLLPWLKTVTTHQCFRYLSRQKSYYARNIPQNEEVNTFTTKDAEEHLSFKDTNRLIHEALASLTPQQLQIYTLSREQGLNSAQIAYKMGLSRGHVRNTLSNILAIIREHLIRSGKICFIGWMIFLK